MKSNVKDAMDVIEMIDEFYEKLTDHKEGIDEDDKFDIANLLLDYKHMILNVPLTYSIDGD